MRVLLFSVSIGAGHDLAAQGIAKEIQRRVPGAQIELVDTFKYINPVLNKVVVESYMETIKFTPKVWGYLYDKAGKGEHIADMSQVFNNLFSQKMHKKVQDFQPDILIASHAFPCGMLSLMKEKHQIKTPLVAIITDYHIHPFWFHQHIDRYIIPSDQLKFTLLERGVKPEQIWSFGLPLREEFSHMPNSQEAKALLGLNEKTTLLIMGGGLGLGSIERIVKNLRIRDLDLQIIVITGKNEALRRKLEKSSGANILIVKGFVHDMALHIAAADVVISKPGGLTVAEVLSSKKPFILLSPIPGQEEKNAEFLLNHGLAIKVSDPRDILLALQQLFNCPLRIKHIQAMSETIGKPYAAVSSVDAIFKELLYDNLDTDEYA